MLLFVVHSVWVYMFHLNWSSIWHYFHMPTQWLISIKKNVAYPSFVEYMFVHYRWICVGNQLQIIHPFYLKSCDLTFCFNCTSFGSGIGKGREELRFTSWKQHSYNPEEYGSWGCFLYYCQWHVFHQNFIQGLRLYFLCKGTYIWWLQMLLALMDEAYTGSTIGDGGGDSESEDSSTIDVADPLFLDILKDENDGLAV